MRLQGRPLVFRNKIVYALIYLQKHAYMEDNILNVYVSSQKWQQNEQIILQ